MLNILLKLYIFRVIVDGSTSYCELFLLLWLVRPFACSVACMLASIIA